MYLRLQNLPPELQLRINHYLPVRALSNLSLCSRYYHELSVPQLYRELTIPIQVPGTDISVHRKMRTYTENFFKRCEHLQSITVFGRSMSESAFPFALRPICLWLAAMLQTRHTKGLRSFAWKLDCPFEIDLMKYLPSSINILDLDARLINCSKHIRNLLDLRCHRICSVEQAEWLGQHAEQNAEGLRRLFLSLESSQLTVQSQIILHSLQRMAETSSGNCPLHYLSLNNMDILEWPFREMPSIRHLCLQQCLHTEEALSRFVEFNGHCMRLRRLEVTLSQGSTYIPGVLADLQHLTHLTSLQLLMGGEANKFPLDGILISQRSLRHLFLESRRDASDPTTVHPYGVHEFLRITSSCCFLKTLSIPMNVSKDSWTVLVKYPQKCASFSTDYCW